MRLRQLRDFEKPSIMIIPMIDIMFFLLVFFMISTLYMVHVKTMPVQLPQAVHAEQQARVSSVITLQKDGSLWLDDRAMKEADLLAAVQAEKEANPNFVVVIRADQSLDYGQVMVLMDHLKNAGITRFGLAAGGEQGQ